MGDDIRAGDVVVAVSAANCPYVDSHVDEGGPETWVGKTYRVTAIGFDEQRCTPLLSLDGYGDGWCAGCFRKLDAAEDVFTKAMQELRPLETEPASTREIHRCRDEVETNNG